MWVGSSQLDVQTNNPNPSLAYEYDKYDIMGTDASEMSEHTPSLTL